MTNLVWFFLIYGVVSFFIHIFRITRSLINVRLRGN